MDDETAIAAFRELELFAGFTEEHLRLLAFVCQERVLSAGEVLYEAGSPPDGAYVLVRGQLQGGEARGFAISAPALVGEMGLMLSRPRATKIVAVAPSTVLLVPREPFMKLLRTHPELAQGVADTLRAELGRYLDSIAGLSGRFTG